MLRFLKQFFAHRSTRQRHALDPALRWGEIPLPDSDATGGFVAFGAPGSGKSIMLRLLMQSVFPHFADGGDRRAMVYDAKGDAMPILAGLCPQAEVRNSNPFDDRGWAWDLCADIREPRIAVEFGFLLIPELHESQPFFADAARAWIIGILKSFLLSGVEWRLGDVMRVLKSERRIKAVLKRHPETREVIDQYFSRHDPRLAANIMSTVATKLLRFEPVAAAWDAAKNRFSLQNWVKENWILVLGNNEASRVPIDAINRCIFRRSVDLLLDQSESFTRRTWYFYDEVSEAGKLPNLVSLLKKGRSKGGCAALALQSVSGLSDPTNYGPHFAKEILGQIANRWIGRLECVETAELLSKLIGEEVRIVDHRSTQRSSQGSSTTVSPREETRRLVLPSELMSIPECNRTNGLTGYYLIRALGAFQDNIPGERLFDELLVPPDPSVPEFVPRPAEVQFLRPWTKADTRKFIGRRVSHGLRRELHENQLNRRRQRKKSTYAQTAPRTKREQDRRSQP